MPSNFFILEISIAPGFLTFTVLVSRRHFREEGFLWAPGLREMGHCGEAMAAFMVAGVASGPGSVSERHVLMDEDTQSSWD